MKIKVSDYIAKYFIEKDITQVFSVVGGGAMHLNDSFGHNSKIKVVYNHHEQASAMAAECYARVAGKPAIVCVTSGPGAINALNGVAGAYQDSIPMIVVSGQVKSTLLEKTSGLNLRTLGGQEFDIVSAVPKMTKYAETVLDATKIKYYLDKAYYTAVSGRLGPTWLDIPLDIQGGFVEEEELVGLDEKEIAQLMIKKKPSTEVIDDIVRRIVTSKRPVLYVGNGVRLSGAADDLLKLIEALQIPVVTCWDSIDLIDTDNEYYCGRAGTMGDRAGNFAVQNSDLLICIGNRLSIYQVGYNVNTWAREAFVVACDIDADELKKPTIRVDLPVVCDAKEFINELLSKAEPSKATDWLEQCKKWKVQYPVVEKRHFEQEEVNVYAFMDVLSKGLGDGTITVVTNGSASVVGSNSYYIGKGSRFLMNCAISSMGYGLPAAVGAAIASNNEQIVCIEGDGSIMMNLQELATVKANKIPIKIFVINNNGYHQIRQTQNNVFGNGLVGVGPESEDLCFPAFSKIADAFGIEYISIDKNSLLKEEIDKVLSSDKAVLCEVFVDINQKFEPKSATKKLEDGSLFSPPLEDLAPFLSREELKSNMYIPLVEE